MRGYTCTVGEQVHLCSVCKVRPRSRRHLSGDLLDNDLMKSIPSSRSLFTALKQNAMPSTLHFFKLQPLPPSSDKSHHSAKGFRNPWPSFSEHASSPLTILKTRYSSNRPQFVPVPADRNELVQIRKPDFSPPKPGSDGRSRMKITWIGHASFLIQCSPNQNSERGINILVDPVFSERTSPVSFLGPKRYTPTPCTLEELCDQVPVDVVCISHNHYDHADTATLKYVFDRAAKESRKLACCVGLNNARWLQHILPSSRNVEVWEGDWWDRCEISLASANAEQANETSHSDSTTASSIKITITPSQHASARSPFDKDHDLWCSFAFELPPYSTNLSSPTSPSNTSNPRGPTLFFAGDTAYRTTFASPTNSTHDVESLTPHQRALYHSCPAFTTIGEMLGPFDLALLPIGLTKPRSFMSNVHADAWDSISMHKDVRAKRSVGMHWGTVRGGISGMYEGVRWPPRAWEMAGAEQGLRWRGSYRDGFSTRVPLQGKGGDGEESESEIGGGVGDEDEWEVGLMDVGESLVI